ncbi:hypothetical protein CYMTET_5533 [Cymbomonas tetramitiformis]|uniref:Major facilitator superfamily (MFS) profile domain-containing protein n=1 Tax=Cymbomonas tetramitiformis TaxID=36881 RepID=A0AAE0H0X3_9CHLO|nr:hypothetical protein CYMTET_5533 [Cymbomonas tetramitiformis]
MLCGGYIERVGRRKFLLLSAAGMACSHIAMAVYFSQTPCDEREHLHAGYHQSEHSTSLEYAWSCRKREYLAWASLMSFIACFSLGMGAIPWVLTTEVFPTYARAYASGLATFTNWVCAYGITAATNNKSAPAAGTFLGFGIECIVTMIFVLLVVPETKGRSLEQIEAFFS